MDGEGEVLGHDLVVLDGLDAGRLERAAEAGEGLVVVELGAEAEAARPGEDGGDGVGRGLVALLVLAVVARDRAWGATKQTGKSVSFRSEGVRTGGFDCEP